MFIFFLALFLSLFGLKSKKVKLIMATDIHKKDNKFSRKLNLLGLLRCWHFQRTGRTCLKFSSSFPSGTLRLLEISAFFCGYKQQTYTQKKSLTNITVKIPQQLCKLERLLGVIIDTDLQTHRRIHNNKKMQIHTHTNIATVGHLRFVVDSVFLVLLYIGPVVVLQLLYFAFHLGKNFSKNFIVKFVVKLLKRSVNTV